MTAKATSPAALSQLIAGKHKPGEVLIIGLTGSVAAGKSTLADAMVEALRPGLRVELVGTDGFLFPNQVLEARGLILRKGFPESYDSSAMESTLNAARHGPVRIPGYSHSLYDIDPALLRTVDRPDVLLVEGLGLAPDESGASVADTLDSLVYLDASEADLEHWFLQRFMRLWHAAADDPTSFYNNFRNMTEAEALAFARTTVWEGINLPNLREHIVHARPRADIVVLKARDHQLQLVRPV
jgi:type I pantothenate kinase